MNRTVKRALVLVTTLALALTLLPAAFAAGRFSDVPDSYKLAAEINEAAERGYVSGYSDNTFRPGARLTNGAFVAMVARAFAAAGYEMPVVAQEGAFATPIAFVRQRAEDLGFADAELEAILDNPSTTATRRAAIIVMAAVTETDGMVGVTLWVPFADTADDPGLMARVDRVNGGAGNRDVLGGFSDGTLRPNDELTRAQGAVMVLRYADHRIPSDSVMPVPSGQNDPSDPSVTPVNPGGDDDDNPVIIPVEPDFPYAEAYVTGAPGEEPDVLTVHLWLSQVPANVERIEFTFPDEGYPFTFSDAEPGELGGTASYYPPLYMGLGEMSVQPVHTIVWQPDMVYADGAASLSDSSNSVDFFFSDVTVASFKVHRGMSYTTPETLVIDTAVYGLDDTVTYLSEAEAVIDFTEMYIDDTDEIGMMASINETHTGITVGIFGLTDDARLVIMAYTVEGQYIDMDTYEVSPDSADDDGFIMMEVPAPYQNAGYYKAALTSNDNGWRIFDVCTVEEEMPVLDI